jgi:hypothetical protein
MASQPQQLTQQVTQPVGAPLDSQLQPLAQAATAAAPAVQAAAAPHLAQLATQVVSSQAGARNVTKIAFGQITDLGTEFHQLREDDQAHVKQLGIDIHMREHLEQQLHAAEERLEHDNVEVAQETGNIVSAPSGGTGSPQNNASDSTPPSLVQALSIQAKAVSDQVALAASRDVKTLNADINSLHVRDVNEMKALRSNAETRNELSAEIAKEREELMANTESLASNLGQIRQLVVPEQTASVPSPAPADASVDASSAAASSSSEALNVVQQESAPVAVDQSATQESASVAVATSAPDAASESSTWLR